MKLTEVRCKHCGRTVFKKKSTAKFCSDTCRKRYWEKFIEPRAICEDCGTLLGIKSVRNIAVGKQKPYCQSCSMFRQVGVGRDI